MASVTVRACHGYITEHLSFFFFKYIKGFNDVDHHILTSQFQLFNRRALILGRCMRKENENRISLGFQENFCERNVGSLSHVCNFAISLTLR